MSDRVDHATGEVLPEIPGCDITDPASLEAWHGNFGYSEHYRKVVLADAGAAERAKDALSATKKRPETQIADDARRSDMYVTYLTEQLKGRILRERNIRDSYQR